MYKVANALVTWSIVLSGCAASDVAPSEVEVPAHSSTKQDSKDSTTAEPDAKAPKPTTTRDAGTVASNDEPDDENRHRTEEPLRPGKSAAGAVGLAFGDRFE